MDYIVKICLITMFICIVYLCSLPPSLLHLLFAAILGGAIGTMFARILFVNIIRDDDVKNSSIEDY